MNIFLSMFSPMQAEISKRGMERLYTLEPTRSDIQSYAHLKRRSHNIPPYSFSRELGTKERITRPLCLRHLPPNTPAGYKNPDSPTK